MITNFENLIVVLQVLYVLNKYVKFCLNWMSFTIQSINLFLCIILDYKNMKFRHLIDHIASDLWFSRNFASIEDVGKNI